MCGEKSSENVCRIRGGGSPPRVRGEVYRPCTRQRRLRIAPACAGRRACSCSRRAHDRDHPRVCGEKRLMNTPSVTLAGSPPRVRGEASAAMPSRSRTRITPACAGRRRCLRIRTQTCEDHPRVCGEKLSARRCITSVLGSPPRVRGEAFKAQLRIVVNGITPACAGRSPAAARR